MSEPIDAIVLGAGGYVGGELLRLLATHPHFQSVVAVSESSAGRPIAETFPHLFAVYGEKCFVARDEYVQVLQNASNVALFSAAPHGASAAAIATALQAAHEARTTIHVVDSSADFRYSKQAEWEAIYSADHGAPELLDQFTSVLPEHTDSVATAHIGHPGCFATASLLAAVPLMQSELSDSDLFISGVTGSTGSGRNPQAGTHHPERNSNIYAYKPLAHRHAPEIARLTKLASGRETNVHFVPHSGPFARGIHVTLQAKAKRPLNVEDLRRVYDNAYRHSEFVDVIGNTPRLKNVVASNRCQISVATDGQSIVVMSVIDNLVKGAAGGAIQWMNRLWNLPESSGLQAVAPGWT